MIAQPRASSAVIVSSKDGVLTLCNYEVAKREPTHKLREAPFCRRCEKAEEKLDG